MLTIKVNTVLKFKFCKMQFSGNSPTFTRLMLREAAFVN